MSPKEIILHEALKKYLDYTFIAHQDTQIYVSQGGFSCKNSEFRDLMLEASTQFLNLFNFLIANLEVEAEKDERKLFNGTCNIQQKIASMSEQQFTDTVRRVEEQLYSQVNNV